MAEPTSTAVATLAAAGASLPLISILGIPLGLRADLLIAGFSGAIVAIALFNAVPATDDTFISLLRVTLKRIGWVIASSLTAGYVTPLALVIANLSDTVLLSGAFAVGVGPKLVLTIVAKRFGESQGGAT